MDIFEKLENIQLVYLFGSRTKERMHSKSDTDIAVLLKEPVNDHLETKLEILEALQRKFGDDVDLTILNDAGSLLKYQVIRNGRLLFERVKGLHKTFYLRTLKEYFDFQPTLDFFYKKTA